MKSLIAYVLILALSLIDTDPVTKIAKANALKREAKAAYEAEEFEKAVEAYSLLIDSMGMLDPRAQLNLANAAYRISFGSENFDVLSDISKGAKRVQDSASLSAVSEEIKYFDIAESNYRALKESEDLAAASMAFNQLGVIAYRRNEIAEDDKTTLMNQALKEFKQALIRNPTNEQARYNYELLKKLTQQQQEQDQQNQDQQQDQQQDDQQKQDQQNKDQQKQDQENRDQKQQEQEQQQQNQDQNDQQEQEQQQQEQDQQQQPEEEDPMEKLMEKLKEMNIPLEKAQMILEAMKNNEIQYVQQKKRKASKPRNSDKPDW